MILLWGLSGEDPIEEVRQALRRRGAPFTFLDQRDLLYTEIEQEIAPDAGVVRMPGGCVDLSEVNAVYLRPYDWRELPDISEAGPGSAAWSHAFSIETALYAWVEMTSAMIINRPSAMASNNSKPYQASIIRKYGFKVPDTIITTDPEAVKDFWAQHEAVIYKSISGVRSIVSRLSADHLQRLEDVAWCPTQFQQYVPGRDYRAHVIGEQIFASEIISNADDYRYASRYGSSLELRACELPDEVGKRAKALAAALSLPVAGVDLRYTPDEEWYCFEVNPSPGFTFYEFNTGQPIADAIAGLLCRSRVPLL